MEGYNEFDISNYTFLFENQTLMTYTDPARKLRLWHKNVTGIVRLVLNLIGLLLNLAMLVHQSRKFCTNSRSFLVLKKPMVLMLMNAAASLTLLCTIETFSEATEILKMHNGYHWPFGDVICKLHQFFYYLSTQSSFCSVTAVLFAEVVGSLNKRTGDSVVMIFLRFILPIWLMSALCSSPQVSLFLV